MSSRDPAVTVEHITKRFGTVQALRDVSFCVEPGTVFALLGENGAGKTTLLHVLLGLVAADRGTARVLGLDPRRDAIRIRRQIGYVPERPRFYEWMTAAETGWLLSSFRTDGYLSRFLSELDRFGVPGNRPLRTLSRGQRALVSLCLATAADPPLLVLDEPTGGMDAAVRREFLESMVDFAATGRTVLLASHEIHEVERVADVVAILHEGQLVVVAPLRDLLARFRWLRLVLRDDRTALPDLGPTVVAHRRTGRIADLLIVDWAEHVEARAERAEGVTATSVSAATLEDVFLAAISGALSGTSRGAGDHTQQPAPPTAGSESSATEPTGESDRR